MGTCKNNCQVLDLKDVAISWGKRNNIFWNQAACGSSGKEIPARVPRHSESHEIACLGQSHYHGGQWVAFFLNPTPHHFRNFEVNLFPRWPLLLTSPTVSSDPDAAPWRKDRCCEVNIFAPTGLPSKNFRDHSHREIFFSATNLAASLYTLCSHAVTGSIVVLNRVSRGISWNQSLTGEDSGLSHKDFFRAQRLASTRKANSLA